MQNTYLNQGLSQLPYKPIETECDQKWNTPCNLCYPEIYYKVQPFVMSACDQMDSCGRVMPDQASFDQISEDIYSNVCTMYPDLTEYVTCSKMNLSVRPTQRNRNNNFRRRGLFQDFVDLLLLNELMRRGFGIF
ncbi:hypothetical protein [Sinanaerobacter sp. ZZT-01]|uniref:hypothetical protein n=1 Tax=Sinanaerobacter sp. ZZT-01 TaxID=3111540 RepID=UPI002D79465C|nr:hypothetical protein [Sinanaerobacter sp. ZZT-01]WRR94309.1 hypothetical protein U5921_04080 [Sinanaerobacter sp. ZZT-01]